MLGLAQYFVGMERDVSGSDLRKSAETESLSSLGAGIFYQHTAANAAHADLVVMSDAIPAGNVELLEARRRGVPILRRAECLDLLGASRKSVLVAGSHGKSTTSAMIAKVLDTAAAAPSFVIGAKVPSLGNQRARVGAGRHFVAEACEAFRNLALFHPDIAVITNIDDDHLEHYGSQDRLTEAFHNFATRAAAGGTVVGNGDDERVTRILARLDHSATNTFGFRPHNQVRVASFEFDGTHSRFEVALEGDAGGIIELPIPGRHAIANALACVATCRALGIDFADIARGLATFGGVSRRWEDIGLVNGIRIIDDYAHHPTALKAAIETARSILDEGQRLVVAFQPQLYSRTRRLHKEFAAVLSACEHVLLLEIDPAGERDSGAVRSALVLDEIRKLGGSAEPYDSVDDLVDRAPRAIKNGDFLLIAGAGNIRAAAPRLVDRLQSGNDAARNAFPSGNGSWPGRPPSTGGQHAGAAPNEARSVPATVVSLFRLQVEARPANCAIAHGASQMTYAELDRASDALARALRGHGIVRGGVVGVALAPSTDLIVSMLSIMKVGATYLPLDENLPSERARFMLSKTAATLLITSAGSSLDAAVSDIDKLFPRDPGPDAERTPSAHPDGSLVSDENDAAYICFTSGSTGYPKGVVIHHQALFGLISDIRGRFHIGPHARMALNTSISFDISLAEIWMTLCGGGRLCVTGARQPLIGDRLADFIEMSEITHVCVTPSVLASMPFRLLPDLRCIMSCGEACPQELVDAWAEGRRFFNVYGPTEATIYATVAQCRPGQKVTIGKAMAHINAYVLDQDLKLLEPDETGELYLGGIGVAKGYINLAEESLGRFFALQQEGRPVDWIYRTGDVVKLDLDGNLMFLGRVDNQVKLRGNRIELEEVEHSIRRLPCVLDAAVCVDEYMGSKELICFVVSDGHDDLDLPGIRDRLSEWLPGYMLPAHFVRVDAVPLTSSGKKDRRSLLAKHRHKIVRRARYVSAPREIDLAAVWKDFLIDPGEIESALRECDGVSDAVVLVRKDGRGRPRSLVAYVEIRPDARDELQPARLTSFLGGRLPAYLVPSAIILVDVLPRLADLTTDRARLAQIDAADIEQAANAIDDPLLSEVAKVFESVIGTPGATLDDNIWSLGGDSLQAIRIAIELESRFGIIIPPDVFEVTRNIGDLVSWIESRRSGRPLSSDDLRI
jgi:UDP-N-acetylmuramate--L-alanine ligase